jgi:hypothetical protein
VRKGLVCLRHLVRVLASLCRSTDIPQRVECHAGEAVGHDPQTTAKAIISSYVKRKEERNETLDARTQYNLACFWTRMEDYGAAMKALVSALETDELLDWANRDPSLRALREKKTDEWRALIVRR